MYEEPCLANDEVFLETFIELGIIRIIIIDVFSKGFMELDFILCLQRENGLLENYVFKNTFNRCFLGFDDRKCKQLSFCEFLMDHKSLSISYQVSVSYHLGQYIGGSHIRVSHLVIGLHTLQ